MSAYSREFGVSRKHAPKPTEEEVREKQQQAVDLRRAGASFGEIAKALGYVDQSGAKKAVEAAIRRHEFESTADVLRMDLARLDEWAKICTHRLRTQGDVQQIDRLMRIMEKRHWLLGVTPATLAETKPDGTHKTAGGMNVVIAPTERVFVRGMMQAVGMDPDSPEGRAYLKKRGLDGGDETGKGGKKTPKKGKRLKKKNPPNPQGGSPSVSPEVPRKEISDKPAIIVEGEVLSSRIDQDQADRDYVRNVSVRRTDEDEVVAGVSLLPSQRI